MILNEKYAHNLGNNAIALYRWHPSPLCHLLPLYFLHTKNFVCFLICTKLTERQRARSTRWKSYEFYCSTSTIALPFHSDAIFCLFFCFVLSSRLNGKFKLCARNKMDDNFYVFCFGFLFGAPFCEWTHAVPQIYVKPTGIIDLNK